MLTFTLLSPLFIGFTGCTGSNSSTANSGVSAIAKIAYDEWDTNRSYTGAKYKDFVGIGQNSPWCAAFVSWCANEAGMIDAEYSPRSGAVSSYFNFYKNHPEAGTITEVNDATPVSGDFFCIGESHIGIVYSYDPDTDEMQIIEGNWDNQLHFGKTTSKGYGITHYIHPNNIGTSKITNSYGCSSSLNSGGGSLDGNARTIYNKLSNAGYSDVAIAAILGNLNRESSLNPRILQGGGEYEDYPSEYIYNDNVGYGIAQWSFHSRSQGLVDFAASNNKHSGDLELQVDYIIHECSTSYTGVSPTSDFATKETDVLKATWKFHHDYESSADSEEAIRNNRGKDAQGFYKQMTANGGKSSGGGGFLRSCSSTASVRGADLSSCSQAQKDVYNTAMSGQGCAVANYCLQYVNDVFAIAGHPATRYCCAHKSMNQSNAQKITDPTNIPIGACVFTGESWGPVICGTCGQDAGHIGIYVGNGEYRENVGGIRTSKVEDFMRSHSDASWGWLDGNDLSKQ